MGLLKVSGNQQVAVGAGGRVDTSNFTGGNGSPSSFGNVTTNGMIQAPGGMGAQSYSSSTSPNIVGIQANTSSPGAAAGNPWGMPYQIGQYTFGGCSQIYTDSQIGLGYSGGGGKSYSVWMGAARPGANGLYCGGGGGASGTAAASQAGGNSIFGGFSGGTGGGTASWGGGGNIFRTMISVRSRCSRGWNPIPLHTKPSRPSAWNHGLIS